MLLLGTISLGLCVITVDPAFIAGHQCIKNCGMWIYQVDNLPAVMTTSFFLIFSEHPRDNLRANLPHLQILANNCMYSSHTDINLYTYCLYRHTTVFIMKFFIWQINSGVLTSLLLPHFSSSLTDSLPSWNLLCHSKTDARFMQDGSKVVWIEIINEHWKKILKSLFIKIPLKSINQSKKNIASIKVLNHLMKYSKSCFKKKKWNDYL